MNAILFIGGNNPPIEKVTHLFKTSSFIAAADSGFDTVLEWKLIPDIVLGDMDSVRNIDALQKIPETSIIRAPKDKDDTDTELALKELRRKGYSHITMIGGGGGRIDHFIALLSLYNRKQVNEKIFPDEWFLDSAHIILVDDYFEISVAIGSTVSVFPVGDQITHVESVGLKWSLNALHWNPGDSGVSNEATLDTIKLNVKSGKVIVVLPFL